MSWGAPQQGRFRVMIPRRRAAGAAACPVTVREDDAAGGITCGLSTGQPVVARIAVKGTPTIDKPQKTIDKYTLENKDLAAITRRDPTIVARIWPVAENYTAMVILDHLFAHYGYQMLKEK